MKVLHMLYAGLGGHGNVFFSLVDADTEKEFTYEALFFGVEEVREQYVSKVVERGINWCYVKKKPGIDLNAYKQIVAAIRRSNPDIIFLHSSTYILPATLAVWLGGRKRRIIIRETQANHLKTKFEWVGLVATLLSFNRVVFLSQEYKAELKKKLGPLVSRRRTTVIPNGIDLNVFKPAPKAVPAGVTAIGMQSRLIKIKDHETLLKAFALLKKKAIFPEPFQLRIAGDGECRTRLMALAAELGIAADVVFLGLLDESELPAFINSLSVYIHATFGETMSTAIMQVMACRLPIIASDVKGVNNMIRHNENGLLVPPADEQRLAAAIEELLTDKGKAARLANNAYEKAVQLYSNKIMFNNYRQLFLSQN